MRIVIITLILTVLLTTPAWARSGYGPLINGQDWRQIEQVQYPERPYSRTRGQIEILEGQRGYGEDKYNSYLEVLK
jgi:hypothetical protein